MEHDTEFLERILPTIDGYLHTEAAQLTLWLLRAQERSECRGGALEIGVWMGKFLSVIFQGTRRKVVGIDIFQHGNTKEIVQSNFSRSFSDTARLSLITDSSQRLSSEDLTNFNDGKEYDFISIDGDHTADAVCNDLVISESALSDAGIIAIDDFLNPMAIGVSEGSYRYFLGTNKGKLVPIAYCANKLFVSRPNFSHTYAKHVLAFIQSYTELPLSRRFEEFRKLGDHWVNQDLIGGKCLILG